MVILTVTYNVALVASGGISAGFAHCVVAVPAVPAQPCRIVIATIAASAAKVTGIFSITKRLYQAPRSAEEKYPTNPLRADPCSQPPFSQSTLRGVKACRSFASLREFQRDNRETEDGRDGGVGRGRATGVARGVAEGVAVGVGVGVG